MGTIRCLFSACLASEYVTVGQGGSFCMYREGETLWVFFEKSEGKEDWQNNLDFKASRMDGIARLRHGEGFYCHGGFLRVWESMIPYIEGALLDLTVRRAILAGYSHGAALALLCHEYIWHERPDIRGNISGFGFGCPRVIWGRVSREKERWQGFYVIRNMDDIVTHLPPSILGYRHVGELIEIGGMNKYTRVDAHRAENYIKELKDSEDGKNTNIKCNDGECRT